MEFLKIYFLFGLMLIIVAQKATKQRQVFRRITILLLLLTCQIRHQSP
jgi:hypothetical protein